MFAKPNGRTLKLSFQSEAGHHPPCKNRCAGKIASSFWCLHFISGLLFCRPIEATLSAGSHASAYESSSVVSGDTEADSLSSSILREEQETSIGTPADLQIARLEAEAARQLGKRRAPKGRQGAARKQVAVPVQVCCRAGHTCTILFANE